MIKHLLSIGDLSREDVERILDTAESFREVGTRVIKKVPALRGRTVVNLFYENSTRTRISFELAAKRLSADVINFTTSGSSVAKGESLKDTALTLQAMGADAIVIRHSSSGAPVTLTRWIKGSVINAGDGTHEHPTQGLLDIFTIRERRGKVAGLRVAIIGDIAHSRVARSNIWGLTKLGASVTIAGPSTMMPMEVERFGIKVAKSVEEAIEGADVVNILRIQLERQRSTLYSSLREYARVYGITSARLKGAKPDVTVMHPGPMNRGVEIAQDVADGEHSVILEQVTNGVAVRMAVLYLLAGHKAPDESAAEHPMPKETKKAHGEPSLHPRR